MSDKKLVAGDWECKKQRKQIVCEKTKDAHYGVDSSSPASKLQMSKGGGIHFMVNTLSNSVNVDSSNRNHAIQLFTEEL